MGINILYCVDTSTVAVDIEFECYVQISLTAPTCKRKLHTFNSISEKKYYEHEQRGAVEVEGSLTFHHEEVEQYHDDRTIGSNTTYFNHSTYSRIQRLHYLVFRNKHFIYLLYLKNNSTSINILFQLHISLVNISISFSENKDRSLIVPHNATFCEL